MKKLLPDLPGIYCIVVFSLLAVFASPAVLKCGDTYWHIKIGQVMLERGELLRHDIFSHTAYGKPWIAHEWLSELLMGAIFNVGGLPGLTLTFLFISAAAYYLMFLASSRLTDEWSTAAATALAIPLTFTHLLIRPHVFTWLFGALTLYLLLRQQRLLWLLPPVTALWANLHGGFVFGLFLQGAFLLGSLLEYWPGWAPENWRRWLREHRLATGVLLLSILASAINPFGFKLLWFPFLVSSPVFAQEIGEWMAFDLQQNWYLRLWFIVMLVLAAVHFRKTAWTWRIIVLFLVYQALGHSRHVSLAALYTLPWVAGAIRTIKDHLAGKTAGGVQLALSPWSGPVIAVLLFVGMFLASIYNPPAWQQFAEMRFTPPPAFSAELIDYLRKGYPGKKLLNEYSLGGYLLFSLENPPPVFIDGRADMYGEEIFTDYVRIAKISPGFELLLDKYGIDWIIFPKDHHLPRYLMQAPGWQRIYTDEQLTLLVRQGHGS